MQKRNRSPDRVRVLVPLIIVAGVTGLAAATVYGETPGPDTTPAAHLTMSSGSLILQGSFRFQADPEPSCRTGKRELGSSANFVTRGSLKVITAGCQDCCAENIVFKDDFEGGGTTAWSNTTGG